MQRPTDPRTRIAALVAAACLAGLIAAGTLWPMPNATLPAEGLCLICGSLGGIDFVANVAFFVPLGVALRLAGVPGWLTVTACATLSGTVEVLQWQFVVGRHGSVGDVVSNAIGGAVGAWFVANWARVFQRPSRHNALVAAQISTVGLVLFGGVAAWALRPAPPDLIYWSQWTPVRGGYAPFTGALDRLSLYGEELPNGAEVDPTREDPPYRGGLLEIGMRIRPASPAEGTMLIARLGNPVGEQFQIAQQESNLIFRSRRNASNLALRSPSLGLRNALGGYPAVPREFAMAVSGSNVRFASNGPPSVTPKTVEARVTIGLFWQSLAPYEASSLGLNGVMRGVLLLLCLFPLSFWTTRATERWLSYAWCGAAAFALVVLSPAFMGISVGGWPEGVGALAGIFGGRLAGGQSLARQEL